MATLMPADTPAPSVRSVMEATGVYSLELSAWLCTQCPMLAPAIVNPERTASYMKSLGLRNKTDRLDARALAFYGADRHPAPFEPLTPEHQALRDLSRYRDALVAEMVAETNRQEQRPQSKLIRKLQARRAQQRQRDIDNIEAEMKRIISDTPHLHKDFKLLLSIPGVGFVTAVVILAEMGDLRRFARARQATAFAGVTPRQNDSGDTKGKPRMCKKGNPRVRQILYMASMAAVHADSFLKQVYQRLRKEGKCPMVALGAIMRKLITIMRAVLITETPFTPGGKLREKTAS
jgi:transposase